MISKSYFFKSLFKAGVFSSDAIISMFLFTPELSCSCGGVIKQMNWTQHLIFNIFFSACQFSDGKSKEAGIKILLQ